MCPTQPPLTGRFTGRVYGTVPTLGKRVFEGVVECVLVVGTPICTSNAIGHRSEAPRSKLQA